MWTNWDQVNVEADFKKLSEAGIEVLRIFPNWKDFQPISAIRNAGSKTIDYRFGENRLPDNRFGYAGVSEEMVNRMKIVLNLGTKYNIKFIIGLITGHMSGRIYIPAAFDGQMPLTDPEVIKWEVKYLKCLVNEFKTHPAIIGWGLGNETNCMGNVSNAQAYDWASLITNTIRSCDNTRPILSDMHSLSPEGNWSMIDQGEITDILTTHPYPLWTKYCDTDPLNTIRSIIHGAAESRYYSDLGGKPVLIEEMGSMGPMIADNKITADFFRAATFSSWANNCHSSMWWCNSDFENLKNAPYDWTTVENELGLFNADGTPKPIVKEMQRFKKFYSSFSYQDLPPVNPDVVCILTRSQDNWAVAQSTFILAKQANLNIEYQYCTQALKDAKTYLLPSVNSFNFMPKSRFNALLNKVKDGALLYISMDDTYFTGMEYFTGLRVVTREGIQNNMDFTFKGTAMSLSSTSHFVFKNIGANILSADQKGNPVFTKFQYGKGIVYLLTAPLESSLAGKAGCFKLGATPFWKIYDEIGKSSRKNHILSKKNPLLGITEHHIDDNKIIAILINYSPENISENIELGKGWKLQKVHYGKAQWSNHNLKVEINENDAVVLELVKV